jgi:hypothetical protein
MEPPIYPVHLTTGSWVAADWRLSVPAAGDAGRSACIASAQRRRRLEWLFG